MVVRSVALACLFAISTLSACHPADTRTTPASWSDPPIDLRDDADRAQAIDAIYAMPAGEARSRARAAVVDGAAAKITEALDDHKPEVAIERLEQLATLWSDDPAAIGPALAGQLALLHRMHDAFAKSGSLASATLVLALLSEVEPAKRAAYRQELDEIVAFADELAVADAGDQARHGQTILLLQPTALVLPLPWIVDRYVALLEERQIRISTIIAQHGATVEIIRSHPDLLRTQRRIANVLARAGRGLEIAKHLDRVKGIGSDRELAIHAEVLASNPTADSYAELADVLRTDGQQDPEARHGRAPDRVAALALCRAAIAKFPPNAHVLAAAANDARVLGRVDQAIDLYAKALDLDRDIDESDALRLGRLHAERITRETAAGRPAAARAAWTDVTRYLAAASRKHPSGVWTQVAALAESALGRGLLGLGLVGDAEHELRQSLERAPSIDALESLATLNLQLDRYAPAAKWADAGIDLLGDNTPTAPAGDRYRRAKLERLAADIERRSGAHDPRPFYMESLRTFASLGEDKDLPRAIASERMLEKGRSLWWLGDHDAGIEAILDAIELDAGGPGVATTAVGFLLEVGRPGEAIDAVHAVLDSSATDSDKTYVALWVVGDARRRSEPADRLASEYLATRHGGVWHELLATAASGKLDAAQLRAAATTAPRKAELAFYSATLKLDPTHDDRALLREVIDARMVMDTEFDLARAYLAR